MISTELRTAILYRMEPPSARVGIVKAVKLFNYADSEADIARALKERHHAVVLPVGQPDIHIDLNWVYPETKACIEAAMANGANCLWLNTILYDGHSIELFKGRGLHMIGQPPADAERFDNRSATNKRLLQGGLPVPDSELISFVNYKGRLSSLPFPRVLKLVEGRGCQGDCGRGGSVVPAGVRDYVCRRSRQYECRRAKIFTG